MALPHNVIYDVVKYIIHSTNENLNLSFEYHPSYILYLETLSKYDDFKELREKSFLAVELLNYLEKEFEVIRAVNRYKEFQSKFFSFLRKKEQREKYDNILKLINQRDDVYKRYIVKVKVSVRDFEKFLTVNPIEYDIKV